MRLFRTGQRVHQHMLAFLLVSDFADSSAFEQKAEEKNMSQSEHKYTREFFNTDPEKGLYKIRDSYGHVIRIINIHEENEFGMSQEFLEKVHKYDSNLDNVTKREEEKHGYSIDESWSATDETYNPATCLDEKIWRRKVGDFKALIGEATEYVGEERMNALFLRYSEKKTLSEIAEILNRNSAQSVSRLLESAVARLKEFLKMHDFC